MLLGITTTNSDSLVGLYPAYQTTTFWNEIRLSFRVAKKLKSGLSRSYTLRPWWCSI